MLADYRQVYDPLGNSLGLSSIVAALPLVTLFVLLGVVRMRAWLASIIGLAVALVVAVAAYSMPVGDAVNSGLLGAAFGFFPIMWIVINAIWIYNLTVETGHFDVLRRSFASISDDQRIQAVIIAFCFGALMEALAGFGTPVAISSVMLIALGFRPLKAATVALVANTAPVAFGALAVPIITLATVTKLPVGDLGAMVGRQTPILAVFVPLALVFIVDGKRGLRQVWPAALVCGATFGVFQYLASNFWSIPLADIIASLASAVAVLAFTRFWHPKEGYVETAGDAPAHREPARHRRHVSGDPGEGYPAAAAPAPAASDGTVGDTPGDVFKAYAPYLIIIARRRQRRPALARRAAPGAVARHQRAPRAARRRPHRRAAGGRARPMRSAGVVRRHRRRTSGGLRQPRMERGRMVGGPGPADRPGVDRRGGHGNRAWPGRPGRDRMAHRPAGRRPMAGAGR